MGRKIVEMKVVFKEQFGEPNPCAACNDEWNGVNYTQIQMYENFALFVDLCDECLKKLEDNIKK
jgi:hypothetical protein